MRKVSLLIFLLFCQLGLAADGTQGPPSRKGFSFSEVGMVPIQSGGRIKPLDSYAREIVLYVTGSRSFEGREPMDVLLSWIAFPEAWRGKELIQVSREDVKRQVGLDEKRTRFSSKELLQNFTLVQYAERLGKGAQADLGGGASLSREQELKRAIERIGTFHAILTGEAWALIPTPAPQPWKGLNSPGSEKLPIRLAFTKLVRAYQEGNASDFQKAALELQDLVSKEAPGFDAGTHRLLRAELFYNQIHPFRIAWIFYLVAALAGFVSLAEKAPGGKAAKKSNWLRASQATMAVGFLSHVVGIAIRCYIAGRPPVTNMYESINWVFLGVMIFAMILYKLQRQAITLVVACSLATLGLIAGDSAPVMMDPSIQPLVPVLRSNYWLTIHVLTITLGYAAFTLTLGLADATLIQYLRGGKDAIARVASLNQLTYRAMQFGVVLLAAGTILGGIWADYSWGRFWGWDPKEVWALIALLCYLAILHGRYSGMFGQFGYAAWSVIAFTSVLMAWYGVNFVLGVGLHSYGFSAGGRGWVFGFIALQALFVAYVAMTRKKAKARA